MQSHVNNSDIGLSPEELAALDPLEKMLYQTMRLDESLTAQSRDELTQEEFAEYQANVKKMLEADKSFTSNEGTPMSDSAKDLTADLIAKAFISLVTGKVVKPKALTELTAEQAAELAANIKKIVAEEKVPEDKQDLFVSTYIDNLNATVKLVNSVTVDNIENLPELSKPLTDAAYAEIGYEKFSPEFMRLADRIREIAVVKSVINYSFDKIMQVAFEKQQLEEQQRQQQQEAGEIFARLFFAKNSSAESTPSSENQDISQNRLSK